jgi:hypothetical protein
VTHRTGPLSATAGLVAVAGKESLGLVEFGERPGSVALAVPTFDMLPGQSLDNILGFAVFENLVEVDRLTGSVEHFHKGSLLILLRYFHSRHPAARMYSVSQAALALAQTGFFRGLGKFVNGRNKTAPAIVDNQNVIVELAHRTVTSRNATCEFFLGSGGGEAVSVLFALEFLFHGINLRVGRTPFVFDVCVIPHKRRKCNAQLV